jgi:hypothetical protein
MTLRPLIPALLATAALASLALTGCSAGVLPGSAAAGNQPPAANSATAPTPKPASGGSGASSCPSSSDVGSTLGIPTPPAPQEASLDGAVSCVYLSGSQPGVTIETIPAHGAAATKLDAEFTEGTAFGITFAPISGIGDRAYSMSKGDAVSGLYVISGDKELSIAATGSTLPKLESLATEILGL